MSLGSRTTRPSTSTAFSRRKLKEEENRKGFEGQIGILRTEMDEQVGSYELKLGVISEQREAAAHYFEEKLKDSDSHDFGAPDELYTLPSFQEF